MLTIDSQRELLITVHLTCVFTEGLLLFLKIYHHIILDATLHNQIKHSPLHEVRLCILLIVKNPVQFTAKFRQSRNIILQHQGKRSFHC